MFYVRENPFKLKCHVVFTFRHTRVHALHVSRDPSSPSYHFSPGAGAPCANYIFRKHTHLENQISWNWVRQGFIYIAGKLIRFLTRIFPAHSPSDSAIDYDKYIGIYNKCQCARFVPSRFSGPGVSRTITIFILCAFFSIFHFFFFFQRGLRIEKKKSVTSIMTKYIIRRLLGEHFNPSRITYSQFEMMWIFFKKKKTYILFV